MLISHANLEDIREKNKDKIIVFCSGVFDITHVGHALFFENCKRQGDILVVGIGEDSVIKKYKGSSRPVLNHFLRAKMVDSLKSVDYCFIDYNPLKDRNFLAILEPTFEKLKPDKWIVNEDAFGMDKRREMAKKYNIELIILGRDSPPEYESISTTKIISKIKELKD